MDCILLKKVEYITVLKLINFNSVMEAITLEMAKVMEAGENEVSLLCGELANMLAESFEEMTDDCIRAAIDTADWSKRNREDILTILATLIGDVNGRVDGRIAAFLDAFVDKLKSAVVKYESMQHFKRLCPQMRGRFTEVTTASLLNEQLGKTKRATRALFASEAKAMLSQRIQLNAPDRSFGQLDEGKDQEDPSIGPLMILLFWQKPSDFDLLKRLFTSYRSNFCLAVQSRVPSIIREYLVKEVQETLPAALQMKLRRVKEHMKLVLLQFRRPLPSPPPVLILNLH